MMVFQKIEEEKSVYIESFSFRDKNLAEIVANIADTC